MEKSSFFNANYVNGDYDRKYKAEDFAEYFATFIGNGVFGDSLEELLVVADSPSSMNVVISPGKAWIDGYLYVNDANLALQVQMASGVYPRIDNVVVRWDKSNREMKAYVVQGTPASSPLAPALTRNNDIWELKLAELHIAAGSLSVQQLNITDTRDDTDVCGYVKGTIEQITATNYVKILTDELFKALDTKETEFEQDFNTWFDTIKGKLSGDVAGNLQNQIDDLKENAVKVDDVTIQKSEDSTISLKDEGVSTEKIANAAVTSEKLSEGAVTNVNIARGAVSMSSLSSDIMSILTSAQQAMLDATGVK